MIVPVSTTFDQRTMTSLIEQTAKGPFSDIHRHFTMGSRRDQNKEEIKRTMKKYSRHRNRGR